MVIILGTQFLNLQNTVFSHFEFMAFEQECRRYSNIIQNPPFKFQ